MPRIMITIETDNAAFDDSPSVEVTRILRKLTSAIERDGILDVYLRDINGNKCGSFEVQS